MQRIEREQAKKYAFDWRDEPLLRVEPGEIFEIETYDAGTGFFKTADVYAATVAFVRGLGHDVVAALLGLSKADDSDLLRITRRSSVLHAD